MAQVLSKFDGWKMNSRKAKYPWDQWLDGRVWEVVRGKDFTCMSATFRILLNKAAKAAGKKYRSVVSKNGDSESVIFQAISHEQVVIDESESSLPPTPSLKKKPKGAKEPAPWE